MKILWITNTALGPIGEKLYGRRQGGLWMDALLTDFKEKAELSLVVATTAKIASPLRIEEDSIVYYALPDDIPLFYDENRPGNKAAWRTLIEVEKPDLIQIWGTEFSHGLCALREAGNIPSVIYMQGYLGAISRHYFAGMTERELDYAVSFRDVLRRDTIRQQQKVFAENTKKEAEMFARSKRIISENEWCNMSVRAVEPDVKIYTCPLSVNKAFSKVAWKRGQIEEHSIMATASGYPLKGLHMLLRAVALLKKEYPDVKLYVPGAKMGRSAAFRQNSTVPDTPNTFKCSSAISDFPRTLSGSARSRRRSLPSSMKKHTSSSCPPQSKTIPARSKRP